MNRPSSYVSLIAALLAHLAAISVALTEFSVRTEPAQRPMAVEVRLIEAQERQAPPVPMAEPTVPTPPAEKKPVKSKAASKPTPKPAAAPPTPRESKTADAALRPVTPAPVLPSTSSAEPTQAAPPPVTAAPDVPSPSPSLAPPPPAKPAPPARTTVHVPPEYAASNRIPAYPPMSIRYGEQGTVVLRVLVKSDGTAGKVEIKTSSGYPLLDEAARTAVQSWRFSPATVDGKPIDDWWLVPVPFKLRN